MIQLYLVYRREELCRVSAEYAESVRILDNKSLLLYRQIKKAYRDIGFKCDQDKLKVAASVAVWAEYSNIRVMYQNQRKIDYVHVFKLFTGILFRQTDFSGGKNYINKALEWFDGQDKDALMKRVYDMDAYNYSWGDIEKDAEDNNQAEQPKRKRR
jgi:hypothetical protein